MRRMCLQAVWKELAVSNRWASASFVLTAAGCFRFCTYCHWMLPVNREGVIVSH